MDKKQLSRFIDDSYSEAANAADRVYAEMLAKAFQDEIALAEMHAFGITPKAQDIEIEPSKWEVSRSNTVWLDDERNETFEEWYEITNKVQTYRCETKKDADSLADTLNIRDGYA